MITADFPAAHSMDTRWFAVDREDQVAYFDPGESGAVPLLAYHPWEQFKTLLRKVGDQVPIVEAAYDLEGQSLPVEFQAGKCHLPWTNAGQIYKGPFVFFLKSLSGVREEVASARAFPVASIGGIGVLFQEISQSVARNLHVYGECLCCAHAWRWWWSEEGLTDPAHLGMFSYGQLCDNWIAGPYGRQRFPLTRLRLDQLRSDLRQQLAQMRFANLNFAETPHIQPLEHGPCETTECAWLALDGKNVRPVPGRDEQYGEEYVDLASHPNLIVELPRKRVAKAAPSQAKLRWWQKLIGRRNP